MLYKTEETEQKCEEKKKSKVMTGLVNNELKPLGAWTAPETFYAVKVKLFVHHFLYQNQGIKMCSADLFVWTCNATKWERAVHHCGGREEFFMGRWSSGTHLKQKKKTQADGGWGGKAGDII